ncbi:MAG: hypothetical protein K8I01_10870 [Candidatus Methylomirabilis sp.]|nr:hypothetical protein [Deltaproteobacteria bacterium]
MIRLFSHRWFSPAFIIFMALLTLAAYSNSFRAPLLFDDSQTLDNLLLRDLGNFWLIVENTRGLTQFTFALNYAVGGFEVWGYHAVNLAVHVLNSFLAYFLLLATFRLANVDVPDSRRLAAFSALLFAVHPVQTQAVTYIVQRMESLSAGFYLLSVLLFARAASSSAPVRKAFMYAGVAASYFLAFVSKEVAYTLPAIILLYDICFIAKGRCREMLSRWPVYCLLAALFAYFTVTTVAPLGGLSRPKKVSAIEASERHAAALPLRVLKIVSAPSFLTAPEANAEEAGAPLSQDRAQDAGEKSKYGDSAGFGLSGVSPKEYLYTQFNAIVYYIALLTVPVNQNIDYDFPWASELLKAPSVPPGTILNIPVLPPAASLIILLAIAGAGLFLLFRRQKGPDSRARVAGFSIFWFFIILSPTSSFVPIRDSLVEHRLYLPSLGFFVTSVLALDWVALRLISGIVNARLFRPGQRGG